MKKLLITVLMLTSFQSFAGFIDANVSDFSLNYMDPSGKGEVGEFRVGEYDFGQNLSFEVEKQAGTLVLRSGEEEVQLDSIPLVADEVKYLSITDANFKSQEDKFSLSLQRFNSEDVSNKISLGKTNFSCTHSGAESEDEYLDGCINKLASFYSSYISIKQPGKSTYLSNLRVNTSNSYLNFSLKYKVGIKGYGRIWYEPNLIKIRIDKVKTGFINITGKVFKELYNLNSDKIEVSRPWIKIKLD